MKVFVLAIILLVFLATKSTTVTACNNVPHKKIEDACKACYSWNDLCQEILQSAPDPAEMTTYVLMATKKAQQNYAFTMNTINAELGAGKPTDEAKKTLIHCKKKYEEADRLMASGAAHVYGCNLKDHKKDFGGALAAIDSCLRRAHRGTWLFDNVAVSYDLTRVAERLDSLIHG